MILSNITIFQERAAKLFPELDLVDLTLFAFIKECVHSPFADKKIASNSVFVSLSADFVNEQMPLLRIQTRQGLFRRLKRLCKSGLIEPSAENRGKSTYYCIGKNSGLYSFASYNEVASEITVSPRGKSGKSDIIEALPTKEEVSLSEIKPVEAKKVVSKEIIPVRENKAATPKETAKKDKKEVEPRLSWHKFITAYDNCCQQRGIVCNFVGNEGGKNIRALGDAYDYIKAFLLKSAENKALSSQELADKIIASLYCIFRFLDIKKGDAFVFNAYQRNVANINVFTANLSALMAGIVKINEERLREQAIQAQKTQEQKDNEKYLKSSFCSKTREY